MNWLTRLLPSIVGQSAQRPGVPEGVWAGCDACGATLYAAELEKHQRVCPHCGHHHPLTARKRLLYFLDDGSEQVPIGAHLKSIDRLKFKDTKRYKERLSAAQNRTGSDEALHVVRGYLYGVPLVVAAFEFGFMGGSMGAVVGERFVQAVSVCLDEKIPLVCFARSGGARMQEGLISLMQMAKVSAALARLSAKHLPFISVLLHPTMGGVSASLGMLGDVLIAEPNALIGFAGPRVIKQTVGEVLPEGFQRSEFLRKHGSVDRIIDRRKLRPCIARILAKLMRQPNPTPDKPPLS